MGVNFNDKVGKANVNRGDGVQNTGDGQNIAMGDGDVNVGDQTFNKTTVMGSIKDVFEEMAKKAGPVPEGAMPIGPIEQPVDSSVEPAKEDVSDDVSDSAVEPNEIVPIEKLEGLEPLDFTKGEDHPEVVLTSIQRFVASDEVPSQEEQEGLFQRMASSLRKYGQSDITKGLASTAAGVIDIVADNMPWQYKVAKYLLCKVAGESDS